MRAVWLTDIHLNFLTAPEEQAFFDEVVAAEPQAVLISGDIAEADELAADLKRLADRVTCPVYFVLGNHDFYGSSIASVRADCVRLSRESEWLRWLPACEVVALTPTTGLVGHDGWGDARLGNPTTTPVFLNDFVHIDDLQTQDAAERLRRLNRLGDEAADYLGRVVEQALVRFEEVVVVTHVPPFREACWHEGQISDDNWLPFFSCAAVGEVLLAAARRHPRRKLLVLCGHTHGGGVAHPAANLEVRTGASDYGEPSVFAVSIA